MKYQSFWTSLVFSFFIGNSIQHGKGYHPAVAAPGIVRDPVFTSVIFFSFPPPTGEEVKVHFPIAGRSEADPASIGTPLRGWRNPVALGELLAMAAVTVANPNLVHVFAAVIRHDWPPDRNHRFPSGEVQRLKYFSASCNFPATSWPGETGLCRNSDQADRDCHETGIEGLIHNAEVLMIRYEPIQQDSEEIFVSYWVAIST